MVLCQIFRLCPSSYLLVILKCVMIHILRKFNFWLSLLRSFILWLLAGAIVVTEPPGQAFLHLFPNLAAIRSCFLQSPKEPASVPFVHLSFWAFTPSCMVLKTRHSSPGFVRPCTQEHISASLDLVRQTLKSLAKASSVSLQVDTRVESIGVASLPSSQLSPALTEQFANFAWTSLASARLALSPSQPVPFPVASFIASSASAKVEAALVFLFFISFPQVWTLLQSLYSTWALLYFFVFATRSAKHVSPVVFLPLALLDEDLASPFCLLPAFSFFLFSFFPDFFPPFFCPELFLVLDFLVCLLFFPPFFLYLSFHLSFALNFSLYWTFWFVSFFSRPSFSFFLSCSSSPPFCNSSQCSAFCQPP